jgi:hypothetical protein
MIKGLGVFFILLFLGFNQSLGEFTPGFSLYFLILLTLGFGFAGVFCILLPENFFESIWNKIREPLPMTVGKLSSELETIAGVVRQEGLLALESKRKDLKDPLLRYLLKKVMDGFEKEMLLPLIRNQGIRREELIDQCEAFFERVTGMIPTIGLIPSLWMMTMALSSGKAGAAGSAALAVVFLPFMAALLSQLISQSWFGSFFEQLREENKLYFVILEEGLVGIQEGQNVELLRDRMKARTLLNPKWIDT